MQGDVRRRRGGKRTRVLSPRATMGRSDLDLFKCGGHGVSFSCKPVDNGNEAEVELYNVHTWFASGRSTLFTETGHLGTVTQGPLPHNKCYPTRTQLSKSIRPSRFINRGPISQYHPQKCQNSLTSTIIGECLAQSNHRSLIAFMPAHVPPQIPSEFSPQIFPRPIHAPSFKPHLPLIILCGIQFPATLDCDWPHAVLAIGGHTPMHHQRHSNSACRPSKLANAMHI